MALRGVFSCVLLCCFALLAQLPEHGGSGGAVGPGQQALQGQVVDEPGSVLTGLVVEVSSFPGNDGIIDRAGLTSAGQFFFNGLPSGPLSVRVTDSSGRVLVQQIVDPATSLGQVQIRLPKNDRPRPVSGLISVAELQHKVPSKAVKEAEKADQALRRNDRTALIAHLEKAVAIDPDFTAALKNLGLAYLQTQQNEKAIVTLTSFVKHVPRSAVAFSAMGAAYLELHRFGDAETAARRTLEIDSASDLGHFLLGWSLMAQEKHDEEALEHLARVSKRYPKAYIACAGILERLGRKDQAKLSLQSYLESGESDARAQAEQWLATFN